MNHVFEMLFQIALQPIESHSLLLRLHFVHFVWQHWTMNNKQKDQTDDLQQLTAWTYLPLQEQFTTESRQFNIKQNKKLKEFFERRRRRNDKTYKRGEQLL